MLNYAEGNKKHTGMGFWVVFDDTQREYGSEEKAAEYYDEAEKQGWTVFSMANDWKTIYEDGVTKTELPALKPPLRTPRKTPLSAGWSVRDASGEENL